MYLLQYTKAFIQDYNMGFDGGHDDDDDDWCFMATFVHMVG